MQSFLEEASIRTDQHAAPLNLPVEVVCLKQAAQGRPVFWIHAAAGGSSIGQYQPIADLSQRTFYGIKPPLIDINHYWLNGVEARASYYIALIKSIDPQGPYDLGGYSMGSTLAYEVARQLICTGHCVRSLVLIDPTDMSYVKQWAKLRNEHVMGKKSLFLMSMNFALISEWADRAPGFKEALVSRDELPPISNEDQWVDSLVRLGQERGLRLNTPQFKLRALQDYLLLESLVAHEYECDLEPSVGMQGFVFFNGSGNMQGSCAPYLFMDDKMFLHLEHHYNAQWLQKCALFQHVALPSTSHFMPLNEPESWEPCIDICRELYARN